MKLAVTFGVLRSDMWIDAAGAADQLGLAVFARRFGLAP
jgi:hypothetical protein